jgi:hypothetical protein
MARTKTKKDAATDPVIESTRAKPWLARQLPEHGPLIFWRDGPDETRDGIVCITAFCSSPTCPCHEAFLDVLTVDDHLSAVEVTRSGDIRMPCMAERGSELRPTRRAVVAVDLESGSIKPDEDQRDDGILAWLREAIDKDVIDLLRRRWSQRGSRTPKALGGSVAATEEVAAAAVDDLLLTVPSGFPRVAEPAPKRDRPHNPRRRSAAPEVYQLKVTLLGIEPPIWRRIRVSANSTLGQLHDVLQIVMGWTNSHLHEYRVGEDLVFGPPDPEREYPAGNELRTPLRQIAGPDSVIRYLYDFGDGWEHEIAVEQVLSAAEAGSAIPTCIDGQRRTPPEDCGGVGGYERLLEVLADPDADEHADMMKWVGKSFDPERFDLAAVSAKRRALAGLRGPARVRGRR